jgi:protein involved in polysaccharide export with SLBB domain
MLAGTSKSAAQRARGDVDRAAKSKKEKQEPLTPEQQILIEAQEESPPIPRGLDAPVDPDTYVIGPGDEFVLVIRGQIQKEIELHVLPEGSVLLPNFGAFPAAGLTITEFRNKLHSSLKRYYKNVEFDCLLVRPRSFVVYVLGEVERPGAVELHAPFRVGTAIELAGGATVKGSLRYIRIVENGEVVKTADLFRFLRLGKTEDNPVLKEKQSVYVPGKTSTANIYGEVWNQGGFEIRSGDTIADLIAFTRGTRSNADFDRIILERQVDSGRIVVERFTMAQVDTVELQDRDTVVIPDIRLYQGGKYVLLRGGGGREGKVFIEEGETIESFIPRFMRLREDHDLSRAVIERENEVGAVAFIPVDLESIIAGEADGNILLQHEDIISIPEVDDYVFVAGEVVNPGEVEFQRGLPAERYIALAGGPSRAGSINKLKIYSRDGSSRDGNRESEVYRGDTILVERTVVSYIGPVFIGLTSFTSLIISVIAVSR